MSQTYRIGTLNFTGSQAILSASLDVSGSGRFTNGLTVTGSLNISGSMSVVNNGFSTGMYDSSSGYLLFPTYNTNNAVNFPPNPVTGSIFLDMGPSPGSTPVLWIYIGGVIPWRWLVFEVPA
jgi:hypothetical protein